VCGEGEGAAGPCGDEVWCAGAGSDPFRPDEASGDAGCPAGGACAAAADGSGDTGTGVGGGGECVAAADEALAICGVAVSVDGADVGCAAGVDGASGTEGADAVTAPVGAELIALGCGRSGCFALCASSTTRKNTPSSAMSPSRFHVSALRLISSSRLTFPSTIHRCRLVSCRKAKTFPFRCRTFHSRLSPGPGAAECAPYAPFAPLASTSCSCELP
jgi:hypothetical protein